MTRKACGVVKTSSGRSGCRKSAHPRHPERCTKTAAGRCKRRAVARRPRRRSPRPSSWPMYYPWYAQAAAAWHPVAASPTPTAPGPGGAPTPIRRAPPPTTGALASHWNAPPPGASVPFGPPSTANIGLPMSSPPGYTQPPYLGSSSPMAFRGQPHTKPEDTEGADRGRPQGLPQIDVFRSQLLRAPRELFDQRGEFISAADRSNLLQHIPMAKREALGAVMRARIEAEGRLSANPDASVDVETLKNFALYVDKQGEIRPRDMALQYLSPRNSGLLGNYLRKQH